MKAFSLSAWFRDTLSLPTWLFLGASLQSLITFLTPPQYTTYTFLLPVSFISYKLTTLAFDLVRFKIRGPQGIIRGYYYGVMPDGYTTLGPPGGGAAKGDGGQDQLRDGVGVMDGKSGGGGGGGGGRGDGANAEHPARTLAEEVKGEINNDSLTVFFIGMNSSHPLGKMAPGIKKTGDMFASIWAEAARTREKSGYLAHTAPLLSTASSSHNQLVIISYWRSTAALLAFARSGEHMKAWKWLNQHQASMPYYSIMHELYEVPKGGWEILYGNMARWGMMTAQFPGVEGGLRGMEVRDGNGGGVMKRMGRGKAPGVQVEKR